MSEKPPIIDLKKDNGKSTKVSIIESEEIKYNKDKMEIGSVETVKMSIYGGDKEIYLVRKRSLDGLKNSIKNLTVLSDIDQQKIHKFLKKIGIRTLPTFRIAENGIYMTNLNKDNDIAISYNNDAFIKGDKNRTISEELHNKYSIKKFEDFINDIKNQFIIASKNNLLLGADTILYVFKNGLVDDEVELISYIADLDSDIEFYTGKDIEVKNLNNLKHSIKIIIEKYIKIEYKDKYINKINELF